MQLFGILTNCVWAYVCVFGRKLQIELQVVPQTFASACLTTPIGIHFPSFCVSQESKLSTMMMGKSFFYFVLLSLLLHCNDVIHVFISVAIHMHTLEILENECHSDIPKGEYFCKLVGRYMENFSDWHNSLPLCLSHDFMYLYGKFS